MIDMCMLSNKTMMSRLLALGVVLACVAGTPSSVRAMALPQACGATADLTRLGMPLSHVARRIASGEPIKIVAIGSSSTAGAGASSSAASYPSRLEVELRARFPRDAVTVLNRGNNGEEASQMLARFDQAVIAEKPDLVIWQVGTNAVLRDMSVAYVAETVRQGIERLKALGADVIVIDPQFAPKILAKAEATERMLELLSASAKMENVDLFRRFAVMRYWNETEHLPFGQFVSPDGLHMNDWGYGCLANLLAGAIADAATRAPQTAGTSIVQR